MSVWIELKNKYQNLIVWGAGKFFEENFKDKFEITYLVDSNEQLKNKVIGGVRVISPCDLKEKSLEKSAIIIFSRFFEDIIYQIKKMELNVDVYVAIMLEDDLFRLYMKAKYDQSFALFGEDAIIQGISRRYDIPISHYIDIGANHPINGNATIAFYLRGADGILVEPNEKYIEMLKACRPRDCVYNVGLVSDSQTKDELSYYMVKGLDTRNTFSKEVANMYKEKGFVVEEKKIKLISLNSLMEAYDKKVNYISIDVEGLEYEILHEFNFSLYNVEIFNIEKGDERVKKLLLHNKYELVSETITDWIFVKSGLVNEERILQKFQANIKNL